MVHYWDSLDSNAYFEFTIYLSGGVVSASKYVMIVWNENYLRDLIYLIDENLNEREKMNKNIIHHTFISVYYFYLFMFFFYFGPI